MKKKTLSHFKSEKEVFKIRFAPSEYYIKLESFLTKRMYHLLRWKIIS